MNIDVHSFGMNAAQVDAARRIAGWNELPVLKQISPLRILLNQFSNVLVVILIAAAVIALALGEWIDALAIGVVVLLNALLGFVQEWRAETALASLRSMMSPRARVIRDGLTQDIPARDLVPGDIIVLDAGANIPADARLIHMSDLQIDESVLTGESIPVAKKIDDISFSGTSVVAGRGEAVVTAIGVQTEFGKVALLTGAVSPKQTHLQVQLSKVARQLGLVAILVAAAVFGLGIFMGRDQMEMVMTALSLSVAIVPEGLPAVVTITLALGAAAMARQNALTRKLQAVETLGAASVICTDKTGTLTENKMTATRIWTPASRYDVTGTGYDPAGHIASDGKRVRSADDPVLAAILQTVSTCTHAHLHRVPTGWVMSGEPTEGALLTLAYKGWTSPPDRADMLAEIPFSSDRKRMSVLYKMGDTATVFTKGAPEIVTDLCTSWLSSDGPVTLADVERVAIHTAYAEMAGQGLRVIGLAKRSATDHQISESDMTFLGLVGLIDPPRPEVKAAVAAAQSAGVRIIMITGDSPVTATAIAGQLDLPVHQALTGEDIEAMDDAALTEALEHHVLFARTKPAHKMRIVACLQAQHQIVAMTGDGVNDAPALKQADIGISMGIRGTDVARDASDLVLLDDNFATIVRAISEGRRQFDNVRKFVRYLLSSNAGEVVALVSNILIGGPLIFLATQILWMNLVTDGVTAVALGLEPSEPDQMAQKPRPKTMQILGWGGIATICVLGLYTGGASLWIFQHMLDFGVEIARTTAFTAMVVFEKISVFAFRSLRLPCWQIGWLSNRWLLVALAVTMSAQLLAIYFPPLQVLLHTVPIGIDEWLLIGAFALPILLVPELAKSVAKLSGNQATTA